MTVNDPFEPATVPALVVPSPQSMLAVKDAAVSLKLLSLNVATCVPAATALPSAIVMDEPETGARPMSALLWASVNAVACGLSGSSLTLTTIVSWPSCA